MQPDASLFSQAHRRVHRHKLSVIFLHLHLSLKVTLHQLPSSVTVVPRFLQMSMIFARSIAATARRSSHPAIVNRLTYSMTNARNFSVKTVCLAKRFTKSHEWIHMAEDGKSCTVGISKYAAEALGDVVYIELPSPGDEVTAEEAFGTVESVKSASDVLSPVSGTITAVNEPLVEKPADLSKDPEDGGWLVKLEVADTASVDGLMDGPAYAEYVENL
ncbi:hypothetical protein NLU13_3615 [Sarocladium strictum]|uniref:Glycine cleavage system H protein n=1 Tax=Sarocladium strictum TaxID=5046 RepID=A0AA39GQ36_SARSR|nr:hypothetical protein NLU13_3615 [Sarocladium strictum]